MPTLSNGSELVVFEDEGPDNQTPYSVLLTITEPDGDVVASGGVQDDFVFGFVDVEAVNVFDGFFTITTSTNDGRNEIFTDLQTFVFDNEGHLIRTLASQEAAYLSTKVLSVSATSPNDITVTWTGANRYFGGENTQYGQHQTILSGGVLQPDTFVNHAPTMFDQSFVISQGQVVDHTEFSARDPDYDLLSFVIVDGPDHGTVAQKTQFDPGYYPFHQGHVFDSYHYHADFLHGNYFNYKPAAGFVGTDSFTVYATDGQGNSRIATITITVTPPAEQITLTSARDVATYVAYSHAVVVDALGGDDVVLGSAHADTIDGGGGNDSLSGGTGGNDTISGGAGDDRIWGSPGNDLIRGGVGRDVLTGAGSNDVFWFDVTPSAANADRIVDFASGHDQIRLASTAFSGLAAGALPGTAFVVGKSAADADDRIVYDKATGSLYFDPDGAGGTVALLFATLDKGPALTAADFVVV
jgi:serralysin